AFPVLEAIAFQDFQERELVLDGDAALQAPPHIGQVKFDGRKTRIRGYQAAFVHKPADRLHGSIAPFPFCKPTPGPNQLKNPPSNAKSFGPVHVMPDGWDLQVNMLIPATVRRHPSPPTPLPPGPNRLHRCAVCAAQLAELRTQRVFERSKRQATAY